MLMGTGSNAGFIVLINWRAGRAEQGSSLPIQELPVQELMAALRGTRHTGRYLYIHTYPQCTHTESDPPPHCVVQVTPL